MAVPKVETRVINDKIFSRTMSGEVSWRLIYDESGEVSHLFESTGITNTPGSMKCFENNESSGAEIEKENLKCYKAIILSGRIIGSFSSTKINTPIITQGDEKVFYSAVNDSNDSNGYNIKRILKYELCKLGKHILC